ncbi:hypothetical protein [Actinomadura sp. 9N407]|uniref:hypothetical protein n=1 Tax=Actinomadura sp. 9N407 TaxID=3375154 RepID=UPI0037B50758
MSEERQERETDRWRALPPRTPLEDLVTGQEVPPRAQVLEGPGITDQDEATRYPI